MSSLFQGRSLEYAAYDIWLILFNLFFAYILNKEKFSANITIVYLLVIFGVVFKSIIFKVDAEQVFLTSRNTVSFVVLTGTCTIYLIKSQGFGPYKYPIWPALASFAASVWAIGRSGILSTGILLLGIFWYNWRTSRKNRALYLILTGALFLLIGLFFLYWPTYNIQHVASRFRHWEITESIRAEMIKNYFSHLSTPSRVILGYDISQDIYGESESWKNSFHNSFVKLHSRIGISSLVMFLLIARGVYIKGKRNGFFYVIMLSLLIRFVADDWAFFGNFDFLFYYFLFPDNKLPSLFSLNVADAYPGSALEDTV